LKANIISISRIIFIPIFIYFLYHNFIGAIIIFFVICISDIIDGYIARQTKNINENKLGRLIDAVSDKTFFLASFFSFYFLFRLDILQLTLLILREVIALLFIIIFIKRIYFIFPSIFGKLVTVFQYFVIFLLVINFYSVYIVYLLIILNYTLLVHYIHYGSRLLVQKKSF